MGLEHAKCAAAGGGDGVDSGDDVGGIATAASVTNREIKYDMIFAE